MIMDSTPSLSLDNLISSPNHDFIQVLNNIDAPFAGSFCTDNREDEPLYNESNFSCSYLDETSFCTKFRNTNNFFIMCLNIQSLSAKFNDLHQLISNMLYSNCAPDVICLQETWQIPNSNLLSLPNYFPLEYLTQRNSLQGGGVGMYLKESVQYTVLKEKSIMFDKIYESLFVEVITSNKKKCLIGSIYRPGNHSNMTQSDQFSQFIELFSNSLSEMVNDYERIFLYGDFNIDVLKYNSSTQVAEYIDLLFSFGFLQIVTKPTRVSDTSATLIDHVLTNVCCNNYETVALCSLISDHFPICHFLPGSSNVCVPKMVEFRDFSEEAINKFKDSIQRYNWTHVTGSECAQTSYNNFSATFTHLYDTYFPLQQKKFNKNLNNIEPWMTKGLLISRQRKIFLSKQFLKNRTLLYKQKFKDYRNVYNKVIRTAKKLYFEKELTVHQSNIKKM